MRRLGRIASRHDARTLRLARYVDVSKLPGAPPARDWSRPSMTWGMFGNAHVGDCVLATAANAVVAVSALTGATPTVTEVDALGAYSAITGYDPARPETDRGTQILDAMKYLRTTGIAGEKLEAFATVDPQHGALVEAAFNAFGPLFVGIDLPRRAQDTAVWDVAPANGYTDADAPNSWGPHCALLTRLDRSGGDFVTWGGVQPWTRAFYRAYCPEVFVPLWRRWDADALSPSGFDVAALRADLAAIA